jgi:hypothetical protein
LFACHKHEKVFSKFRPRSLEETEFFSKKKTGDGEEDSGQYDPVTKCKVSHGKIQIIRDRKENANVQTKAHNDAHLLF